MADADDPICLGPNEGFLDGYCSEFCDLANPSCGGDGICVDTATTLGKQLSVHGVCLDTCTGPGDCRPGYDCVDRNLGQNVCMLAPEKNCEDFVDNDLDGLMDCQDPDCKPMVACTGGAKAAGRATPLARGAGLEKAGRSSAPVNVGRAPRPGRAPTLASPAKKRAVKPRGR
jgi:hypothetical protein